MSAGDMLYDFINGLNEAVKIGEDEYTNDFDSEELIGVNAKTGETALTKITVLESEYADDYVNRYSYSFGLADIDLDEIDGYDFDIDKTAVAIKSYTDKMRPFIESQRKELEQRLEDLNIFIGKIDKGVFFKGR